MADIADDAAGPADEVDTGCGRAFDTPDTGSALEDGHRPLVGLFFDAQVFESPLVVLLPLVWGDGTVTVELVEVEEAIDEEELVRCMFLGRGMNIRDTSSVLIPFNPPCEALPVFHPSL